MSTTECYCIHHNFDAPPPQFRAIFVFRSGLRSSRAGCEEFAIFVIIFRAGAGSASRMLLYLSCPDLKPGEADASLHELNIERRHVNFDQLLIEGPLCHRTSLLHPHNNNNNIAVTATTTRRTLDFCSISPKLHQFSKLLQVRSCPPKVSF